MTQQCSYDPSFSFQVPDEPPGDICFNEYFGIHATVDQTPCYWYWICPYCLYTQTGDYFDFDTVDYNCQVTAPDYNSWSNTGLWAEFTADQEGTYEIDFMAHGSAAIHRYSSISANTSVYVNASCTDGCYACDFGACQQLYLSSLDIRLSLGNERFKRKGVGQLRLLEARPGPLLASPQLLKYEGFQGPVWGVELIHDGGMLRQVKTPQWPPAKWSLSA